MSQDHHPQPRLECDDGALPDTATAAYVRRIVVLGDIHLYRLAVAPWRLVGKRLAGQANLWFNRRRHFDRSLLAGVVEKVRSIEPDLLLLTGDLTTTALDGEFADATAALSSMAPASKILAIAGNHDRYTYVASAIRSFERHLGARTPQSYPHVRPLTPRWWLLAIDAAVPRMVSSRGHVADTQLQKVRQVVSQLPVDCGLIVLCHYPFKVPSDMNWPWHHRLADAAALGAAIGDAGRRVCQLVYLHGHVHQPWSWHPLSDGAANVRAINAGAPCRVDQQYPAGQGFWQIDLPDDPAEPANVTHHVPAVTATGRTWQAERVE